MGLQSKQRIARERGFTTRAVDIWVTRGLLSPPMKLGTTKQAHVRWTDEQVAALDANLAALGGPMPGQPAVTPESGATPVKAKAVP